MLLPLLKRYPCPSFVRVLLLLLYVSTVFATELATFSDDNCQESLGSLPGPNGYPNGTCTQLMEGGIIGSFQVVQEDPGCDVTLYGSDAEESSPCSDDSPILAEIAKCYNTSWVYYSIDTCIPPHSTSYHLPTPTSSPEPSEDDDDNNNKPVLSTAAIIGIVVGGILAFLALNGLAWFLVFRRNRHKYKQLNDRLVAAASSQRTESLPPHHDPAKLYVGGGTPTFPSLSSPGLVGSGAFGRRSPVLEMGAESPGGHQPTHFELPATAPYVVRREDLEPHDEDRIAWEHRRHQFEQRQQQQSQSPHRQQRGGGMSPRDDSPDIELQPVYTDRVRDRTERTI